MAAKKKAKGATAKNPNESKGRGRPSIFTQELANEICERLSAGEPMAAICRDDHMPSYFTVRAWEVQNHEFLKLSTRARRDGTHFLADKCLEIADDLKLDPQHKRIMIETRIRLIGKWNTKEYGDKLDLTTRDETPPMGRADMVELMRNSPAFRQEVREMVEEAERTAIK